MNNLHQIAGLTPAGGGEYIGTDKQWNRFEELRSQHDCPLEAGNHGEDSCDHPIHEKELIESKNL